MATTWNARAGGAAGASAPVSALVPRGVEEVLPAVGELGDVERIIVAACAVAAGPLVGVPLHLLFRRLGGRADRTTRPWDELVFTLLRDLTLTGTTVAGLWVASLLLDLNGPVRAAVRAVLLAVLILAVTVAVARLGGRLVGLVAASRAGVANSASIFVNIARALVLVVGLLVLLGSVGISITPLLTALGVGGLAVALALQDTLANLFAGVHILAARTVQPGDFVRLDSGEDGYIVDINWRNTTMRQVAGNLVVIPNSRFAGAILVNFHQPAQDMSVPVQLRVGYDCDLDKVERVTVEVGREVMTEVKGGVPEHEPTVRFHTFGESSIDFSISLRASEYLDQYLVIHEFIKRLHDRYRDEGISVPFPTRTVTWSGTSPAPAR